MMSVSASNAGDSGRSVNKHNTVIVIGAGASGLGAARALFEAGYTPIILEARDRIGGRVHNTIMYPNLHENEEISRDNYIHVPLGANWIHGLREDMNPMYSFAKKLNLLLQPTSSDDAPGEDVLLFDQSVERGMSEEKGCNVCSREEGDSVYSVQRVSKEDYHLVLRRYEWIKTNFEECISVQRPPGGIIRNLQKAFDVAITASEAVYGRCSELHRRCLNWLLDRVAIDMGSPLSLADTKSYVEGDSCGLYGEAVVCSGGYYRILEHLAHEYPLDIRLNKVVQAINVLDSPPEQSNHLQQQQPQQQEVSVVCADGEIFRAQYCVVTVPWGVLQTEQITFNPAPPLFIQRMTPLIGMSLMNLVWLWFPYQFWPDDFNFFGLARPTLTTQQETRFTTFLAPRLLDRYGQPQPILMCQVVGPFAEKIELMPEADIAQQASEVLRSVFRTCDELLLSNPVTGRSEVPDAIGCMRSQWRTDKFAGGSWTYFPYKSPQTRTAADVGEVKVEETVMDQRVLYAGEAVNEDYRGTVHGAYVSGTQAAAKIIKALKQPLHNNDGIGADEHDENDSYRALGTPLSRL